MTDAATWMDLLDRLREVDPITREEAAQLAGVTATSWVSYVARGTAPKAIGHHPGNGLLIWDRAQVQAWVENRPGRGFRSDLAGP